MEHLLHLFVKSVFVDNMIFAYFLGMCSYLAVSKTVKVAAGLGTAVLFVLVVTIPLNYLLNRYLLVPHQLEYLSFILFIAVIAAMVQLVEMVVERFSPSLYQSLGIFLPLIAVNCAIMGGSLFMQERHFATLGEVVTFSLGSGVGWLLAITSLAAIREKLHYSHIPKPLQGLGISFIITGLMGIAFMSFMGIAL